MCQSIPVPVSPVDALLVLTLRSFLQRQAQFTQFLASNKALSASRYFRLMALACVEMMFTVPVSMVFTVLNLKAQPYNPWISWADTHYNFSRVLLITSVVWRESKLLEVSIEFGRWSAPFCAFAFFAFFGFAEESRKNYKKAIMTALVACRLVKQDDASLPTKPTPSSKHVPRSCCPLRNLTLRSQASPTCAPLLFEDITRLFAHVHSPSSAIPTIKHPFVTNLSRRKALRAFVASNILLGIFFRCLPETLGVWRSPTTEPRSFPSITNVCCRLCYLDWSTLRRPPGSTPHRHPQTLSHLCNMTLRNPPRYPHSFVLHHSICGRALKYHLIFPLP